MMMTLFFCQPLRMKGPPPAEFWFSHSSALSSLSAVAESLAPCSLASFESMMAAFGPDRTGSQSANDSLRTVFTVIGSTTTTSLSGSIIQPGLPLRFLSRVRLNFTSSAVNGLPLACLTFGRSLNVYSLPSGETFHSVARTGTKVFSSFGLLWATSVS